MAGKKIINIAAEFSPTPGARYPKDGDFSGELFRSQFLEPLFSNNADDSLIVVELDGTEGYATSFLDEAFGGLARMFGKERVLSRLQFISKEEPLLEQEIRGYILASP